MRTIYALARSEEPGATVDWLVNVIGFSAHSVAKGDDGQVSHAELVLGDDMIMVGQGRPGGPGIYIAVDDPDAHHDRVAAADTEITQKPTDQPYGSREYACKDPGGSDWYFGTYRP
ncbi:bleomycin resistance protein [Spongiactinospora gelatinilytica]|uniref:Bleomycin resistance protein n=1 Tax=Spongiactinospora gelatinilytica TaxID=2666298 RepID=A0A2W2FMJ0_9ACTN|nr:VOC family protein [Spongiactinospora gelatinilytica]PZG29625.1 bleomycin resistance protein [Spongiactinospora gelatinilytica]